MLFLYIHLGITALYLLMQTLMAIDLAKKFKHKYPDLKPPKPSVAGRLLSSLRNLIVALIPLYNILLCFIFLFKYEELEAKSMNNVYQKCIEASGSVNAEGNQYDL